MVDVVAAVLLLWGEGEENHKSRCPDIVELLNQKEQPPISGLIISEKQTSVGLQPLESDVLFLVLNTILTGTEVAEGNCSPNDSILLRFEN